MKKAVVFLADGFEEIEAITPIDLLRRAGVEVTIAGLDTPMPESARKVKVQAEVCATTIKADDFDAFILPGGGQGAINLKNSDMVVGVIKDAFAKNKLVAAICAAPIVLDRAGVLKDKKYTCYPSTEKEIKSGTHEDKVFIKDGNVITARGPGAAAEFSFAIIEYLAGKEKANEVRSGALF